MKVSRRIYRARRRRRSGLASTRSTAILPRERCWMGCGMGCSSSSFVRRGKVGESLGRRRRGSVVAARGRNRESGARQKRRLDYGVVGRSSIRRRGGVRNDRRIVGGTKKRELASQTIYLSMVSRWLRHGCITGQGARRASYHCLLLLFQLHMKLRSRQWPRVSQRSWAWPDCGIG